MTSIRFYIFAARWLWKNRSWSNTRQKFKALDRAWSRHEQARQNGGKR